MNAEAPSSDVAYPQGHISEREENVADGHFAIVPCEAFDLFLNLLLISNYRIL